MAVSSLIFTWFWLQEIKVMQGTSCFPAQKNLTRFSLLLPPPWQPGSRKGSLPELEFKIQVVTYTFLIPHILPRFCISICFSEAEIFNTLKDLSVQLESKNPIIVAFINAYIKGHFSKPLYYEGFILLPLAACGNTWLCGYTVGVWFHLHSILKTSQSRNVFGQVHFSPQKPSSLCHTSPRLILFRLCTIKTPSTHTESKVTNWDPRCSWIFSKKT